MGRWSCWKALVMSPIEQIISKIKKSGNIHQRGIASKIDKYPTIIDTIGWTSSRCELRGKPKQLQKSLWSHKDEAAWIGQELLHLGSPNNIGDSLHSDRHMVLLMGRCPHRYNSCGDSGGSNNTLHLSGGKRRPRAGEGSRLASCQIKMIYI